MIHFLPSPYLNLLFWFVWLPLIILWVMYWRVLIKYKMIYLKAIAAALLFSVPWDLTAYVTKIWSWPEGCCLAPRIVHLPLEEYGFLIFVTLLIVTVTLIFWNHLARRPYKS